MQKKEHWILDMEDLISQLYQKLIACWNFFLLDKTNFKLWQSFLKFNILKQTSGESNLLFSIWNKSFFILWEYTSVSHIYSVLGPNPVALVPCCLLQLDFFSDNFLNKNNLSFCLEGMKNMVIFFFLKPHRLWRGI